VNEQPPEYWIARSSSLGFKLSAFEDTLRSSLKELSIPPWYKRNIHAFEK
jgi:hypothetical protein